MSNMGRRWSLLRLWCQSCWKVGSFLAGTDNCLARDLSRILQIYNFWLSGFHPIPLPFPLFLLLPPSEISFSENSLIWWNRLFFGSFFYLKTTQMGYCADLANGSGFTTSHFSNFTASHAPRLLLIKNNYLLFFVLSCVHGCTVKPLMIGYKTGKCDVLV